MTGEKTVLKARDNWPVGPMLTAESNGIDCIELKEEEEEEEDEYFPLMAERKYSSS